MMQARAKARSIMTEMENAKLGGRDYPLPALAELREVWQLTVKRCMPPAGSPIHGVITIMRSTL